jgi:lysine 6-dehydrogenase
MKYVVIGAGAMGKIAITDLFHTDKKAHIIVADYNINNARRFAGSFKSSRVTFAGANAKDVKKTSRLLKGCDVCVNCVQYELNLYIMRACLNAKCNYVDLGGLFHVTKKQLRLNSKFKKIGKVAVLGMGASPGIVNVLAAYGASKMDRVHEIHIRLGYYDNTKVIRDSPFSASYSVMTIFEEFSYKPAVFTKGKIKFVQPMTEFEEVYFPSPVGKQRPMMTLHSEIATLPVSFKNKGIKECSFKIAFDDEFVNKVRLFKDMGMLSTKPIKVRGVKVSPRDFLIQLVKNLPPPIYGKPIEHEIIRVIMKGTFRGRKKAINVDCHATGMPKWGIGLDIDTGSPPSIVAQMITKGQVGAVGVFPPERCIYPKTFIQQLKKRRMFVKVSRVK